MNETFINDFCFLIKWYGGIMSLGSFETRLVASAKLSSMEKYGWAYNEDLEVVKSMLSSEVTIIDDGTGTVKIQNTLGEFAVEIRDYQKRNVQTNEQGMRVIPPDPEREGKFVSVWEIGQH